MRTLINTLPEANKLREPSRSVDLWEDRELIVELSKELQDYVRKTKNCAGISAIQFGEAVKMFVVKSRTKELTTVINPIIMEPIADNAVAEEGCMSFPNMYCFVPRPAKITVSYTTLYRNGNYGNLPYHDLYNLDARIFLHENDHLKATEMFDIAKELTEKQVKGLGHKAIYKIYPDGEVPADYFVEGENVLFFSGKTINPSDFENLKIIGMKI